MFCMGCGAEVPPRAVVCAVCGRDTGRGGEPRAARSPVDPLEMADATIESSMPRAVPAQLVPSPAAVPAPSIGSGDLDQPGFPRDALGRSLIFTVLAMAADLLAPWVNLGGNRVAPSSFGVLALLAVLWLGLALLPLLRPSLRATPIYAAAPLVVGATSLGLAAAVWIRFTLLGSQTVVDSADGSSLQALGAANSADVGLYLFLAGALVLIVAGYQLFLAAAHTQARAELRAKASLPLQVQGTSTSTSASNGRSVPAAAPDGTAAVPSGSGPVSRPLPLPPMPAAPHAPPAGQHGVALPGSAAWSQTPNTPPFQRPSPSLGWRRRG